MGRGREKGNPKSDPKQGGRLDRKVVIEYSSDESLDEDNPQPVEGAGAPKHMKKQIHLTLPKTPTHVTTTESFATFFINHGLMKPCERRLRREAGAQIKCKNLSQTSRGNTARKCHSPSCTWMKIHQTVRDLSYKMGPWLVERPLEEVQAVANQGGSHLLVVVAVGELEDWVALAAAVVA